MEQSKNNFHIVIAAKQFIFRFGIKTIISVLGLEPDIFETDSFDKLKRFIKKNQEINFIILSEDIIPNPRNIYLKKIKESCICVKIMVMGDEIIKNCQCSQFILNRDKQKEVLEKFQDFFFEPEMFDDSVHNDTTLLSQREKDVLKLVAQGYSNKEIANNLFISINTVITHRKNITEKLDIKTIAGLTVYAMINNIISANEVRR